MFCSGVVAFISHLTRAKCTQSAASTVQVFYALIIILQHVHPGSHDTLKAHHSFINTLYCRNHSKNWSMYIHYHLNSLLMKDCARGMKGKFHSDACRTVLLNVPYGVENVGKIWSGCWQQEMQYAKWIVRTCQTVCNFICLFLYTSLAVKLYW
jgi:hypothetical protein